MGFTVVSVEGKLVISRTSKFWVNRPDLRNKRWLLLWVAVSSIIFLSVYMVRPRILIEREFDILVNSMNVISYILVVGIPVFLSVGIIFGSSATRKHIIELKRSGMSSISIFLRHLFKVYTIVLGLSLTITVAMFLEPIIVGTVFSEPTGTGYLIYFPAALVATIAVSLILVSFGVLLVTITDDILFSTTMGFLVLGGTELIIWRSTMGMPIALFSPWYFIRIFAVRISGYDDQDLSNLFRFVPDLSFIVLILVFFGLLVFAGLIVSHKLFQYNTSNWEKSQKQEGDSEIWDIEQEETRTKIKQHLRRRRLAVFGLVMCLLIVITFHSNSTGATIIEQNTFIIYESLEEGDPITLGEWYFHPCQLHAAQFDIYIDARVDILDWGNSPDNVDFYYEIVRMSSSDFQSLNDTEQLALLRNRSVTRPENVDILSRELTRLDVSYTFIMRAVATENATLSGVLYCSIEITQYSRID